jgi:hypothetical protein
MNISVLFTQKNSVYNQFNVDVWDEVRDARLYAGQNPVICHPPCRLWSKLSHFSTANISEKDLAPLAVEFARSFGGVVEHPRSSRLFKYMNIPLDGSPDKFGGYLISVDQFWFGHRARKATLLYIVGCPKSKLPALPLKFDAVTHTVSACCRLKKGTFRKPEVSKYERNATPFNFALWLFEIAKQCHVRS